MTEFADATRVDADGRGEIADGWDIGGNANGGYLLALAASRMRDVSGRPDPISVSAHYLAPGSPGTGAHRHGDRQAGQAFRDGAGHDAP